MRELQPVGDGDGDDNHGAPRRDRGSPYSYAVVDDDDKVDERKRHQSSGLNNGGSGE